MVMFDPKKFYEEALKKEKYETERQDVFLNTILLERKKVTCEINLSINIQNINIYFPFEYSSKDNMLHIQLKDLKLYKREDQNDINPANDNAPPYQASTIMNSVSMSNLNQKISPKKNVLEFNPILLKINCLKILIVSDYKWEQKENLFIQNLQRLKNTKLYPTSPLDLKINNSESFFSKSESSKIILETLPISFRLEKFKTLAILENADYLFQKNIKRLHTNDKKITPQTSKLSIDMPMIIVNLTIGQLYTLMSLVKIWQESGPDLYKAVMDETKISNNPKPELLNPQKLNKNGNMQSNNPFAQRNAYIDPNIDYGDSAVEELLKNFEISLMNLYCEGVNFSIYLKNHHEKEILNEGQKHANRLFSVFIDSIKFSKVQKYFNSEQNIHIRKIILQNHNCLDLDLRALFKKNLEKKLSKEHKKHKKDMVSPLKSANKSTEKNKIIPEEKENRIVSNLKINENDLEENKEKEEEFKNQEQEDTMLQKLSQELSEISKIKLVHLNVLDSRPELEQLFQSTSNYPKTSHPENLLASFNICKLCTESIHPHRRLIINSLNHPNEDADPVSSSDKEDHINICIKTTEKEMEKFKRKKVTYQDIKVQLTDFIIVVDPTVIQTLRSIFDISNDYSDQKLESFKKFMRNNGFWPDFMFHEQNPQKNVSSPSIKSEVADSRFCIVMNSLTLLFHFQRSNIYILNLKSLVFTSENYNIFTTIRLTAENLSLHDTSANTGNHTDLILNYDKTKTSKLDCEIKLFDENFSSIKKFSTYVGVRILNARVLFLKRIVSELVEYLRKHVFPSFSAQETLQNGLFIDLKIKDNPVKTPSSFKLEILIMDSMLAVYQNSISENLLYVEFNKLCIWSTGLWGMDMGELLKTGYMDFEKNEKDSQSKEKNDEEFFDVNEEISPHSPIYTQESFSNSIYKQAKSKIFKKEKIKKPEKFVEQGTLFFESRDLKPKEIFGTLNNFLEGTKSGLFMNRNQEKNFDDLEEVMSKESEDLNNEEDKTKRNNGANQTFKEIYCIRVEELKILTNKDCPEEETLFVQTPKDSMTIDINIEDEDFAMEGLDDENNKERISWPITINLKVQKLWIYSYEPEFSLLMNILQENLGEIPTTVIDPTPADIKNDNIYLYVKVTVEEALLKIFKGTRDDLREQNRKIILINKPRFLYKNASSLALIDLKQINFKMLMQENGGKKMILSINQLDVSDLRLNSRLTHYNKSVLFSIVSNQFTLDENTLTATTQEAGSPCKEMNEININGDELNQNFEYTHDPDKGLEIELDFDQNKNQKDLLQPSPEKKSSPENKEKLKNELHIKKKVNFNHYEDPLESSDHLNSEKDKIPKSRKPSLVLQRPPSLVLDANPIALKMKKQNYKEKILGFFSKMFACCKRKKKKNTTINLFDLIPNSDMLAHNNSTKRQFWLLSPTHKIHSGSKNFLLKDQFIEESPPKEKFQDKSTELIIHSLKSVKQPNLEDSDDEVKNFQGSDAEFKLIFTSKYDGEKLIKIKVTNKNLILLIDLLSELVSFFMKPFDGSDIPSYIHKKPFNNNPPMIVKVELSNIYLILLADFKTIKDTESIAVLIDLKYDHKWLGDAYVGPGSIEIVVGLDIKKFCLFKTPDLMNDDCISGNVYKANITFFNLLVEQFEIKFVSNYRIAFYTEDKTLYEKRKYNPSDYTTSLEKILTLKNPNGKKEIHLPIKKIKGIIQVINLLTETTLLQDPNLHQNNVNAPQQNHLEPALLCVEQFDVTIEQINIHILKNKNKVEYGKLIFKDFRLVGIRKNENYKFKLRGTVSIDYFNKRKMDFEPLLEPWTLMLIACQISGDLQIVLQNDQNFETEAYFVKENKNSLNFNITTAGIETILEAYQIFSYESLDEKEPCKLYNKMGCMLRYRNAKLQEKQKIFWLQERKTCDIWSKFKPKKPTKSKSVITHTAINILLVNKDLSNIIQETQFSTIPEEKQNEDDQFNIQNHHKKKPIMISNSSLNTSSMTLDKKKKKFSSKGSMEHSHSKFMITNKSGNEPIKKVSLVSSPDIQEGGGFAVFGETNAEKKSVDIFPNNLETIYEHSEQNININRPNTPQSQMNDLGLVEKTNIFTRSKNKGPPKIIEGLDSEKDHKLSDYRMIKDISLDHVGKTVYKLERINRINQNKQNSNKNIFGIDLNFDSLDFLSKTRKINEEGNSYMLVDVRFSPKKGYKEIFVTTCVKFLNKMNTDIEISFYWKYKKNALKTIIVKPDHEYYIPLKFIEASTLVTFKNNRLGGFDYIDWEDDRSDDIEDSNSEEKNEEDYQNQSPGNYEKSTQDSPDNRRVAAGSGNLKFSTLNANLASSPPTISHNLGSCQTLLKPSGILDPLNSVGKKAFLGIEKGYSVNLNKEGVENREKQNCKETNININPLASKVPISAEYEKHDLDKFICDKVTLGEFEQVDQHELYKKEHAKKGLLVYKNDFVVNSIHHHGKASYGNFYFILSCVKAKMETQKRHNKEREEVCYETTLILLPIFKITNLTMSPLVIEYGAFAHASSKKKNPGTHDEDHKYSKKTLFPKSSYGCSDIYYGDDLSFNLSLKVPGNEKPNSDQSMKSRDIRIYKSEKNFRIPIKLKAKNLNNLTEIRDIRNYKGKNFYLWAEFKKTSPKSREIIIFCPYLIIDETNKLYFKESSSFLSTKTYSKYFKSASSMKKLGSRSLTFSQIFEGQGTLQKEENFDELLEKANINNPNIKDRVKKELEVYKKIHMFSTSKKMKAIQIALQDSLKIWSKPCPLQTTEDVLSVVEAPMDRVVQQNRNNTNKTYDNMLNTILNKTMNRHNYTKQARKKYQFGVKILPAPDPFFRSKLIVFTPRYMIKNESDNLIAIAQYDTEHSEDDIIRIRKDQWHEFHWTDHKKKEYLVMSLCNKVTGNVYGWSGRFKIDKVQEIVVKLRQKQDNEFELTKVSINIYENVQCIRIINEDKQNPPYSLRNETNHEIAFRHKIKIGNKRNQEEVPFTILYPGDSVNFTWEQWDDENDRILQVEIEGQLKDYPIEKTQECDPFILNPPTIKNVNRESKTHIYRKGYLKLAKDEKKKKDDCYCVLSVANQKMKLYDKDNSKKDTINLKGAKIENAIENEFILKTSKNVSYQFKAKNEVDKSEWINHIWKSILLENPEIIFVKIEPVNLTKAIKFHSEGEDFLIPLRDPIEEGDEPRPPKHKRKESTYIFRISNAIGISLIDSLPREIVQISIKKIEFSLVSIETVNNDRQSDQILDDKGECIIKTSWINLSIDSFMINDQLMDAQFPVILAPNKKKINEKQQFFQAFINTVTYF